VPAIAVRLRLRLTRPAGWLPVGSGAFDDSLLEALEDYAKRQRKRPQLGLQARAVISSDARRRKRVRHTQHGIIRKSRLHGTRLGDEKICSVSLTVAVELA
jgi:hypothetical protein